MFEFVLFCLPAAIYLFVQSRGENRTLAAARLQLGLTWGSANGYAWAGLLLFPLLFAGWLAIVSVPAEVVDAPGVSVARLTSLGVALSVVLRAFGEEILFRGLLGGVLSRRLGFQKGNLLQSLVFVVPHLGILLVDIRAWPVIPAQFAAAWILGWLREKTGTFVPGALVHAAANMCAGLLLS
ncbi:CPBP family intramembrane metalloprotease [Pseudoclavibacter sp. RFBI5]|uniref:CPBP family intramembrane glutamic endopeptidase n=1 Tax=Pseudoclavibacter sp. RFBI5 TaxID=2080578 RepID=UPI000CE908E3|nr:CPBP family intramembrane glutamic endopeptidase [Pseudoclavibacter sp. RFBI5]PPG02880.1 CPBP family intramembrane metalloprotease [Pseudoclavibacter sp. RFBI5]